MDDQPCIELPHDPKNDMPAERRIPTPENLRKDVLSACRQVDSIREQCVLRLSLKGRRVVYDRAFLDSFAATLAVGMHQGWREDCQVLVVIADRNASSFVCRRTMASVELTGGVVAKLRESAMLPYNAVPLRGAPLESLLVLTPAGKAEPQWATSIADPRRLRSILASLARDFRANDASAIDPSGGLLGDTAGPLM